MVSWTCILFFVKNPDTPPAANKTAMALSNVFVFLFINHSLLYPKTCFYRIPRGGSYSFLPGQQWQFLLLSLSKTFLDQAPEMLLKANYLKPPDPSSFFTLLIICSVKVPFDFNIVKIELASPSVIP